MKMQEIKLSVEQNAHQNHAEYWMIFQLFSLPPVSFGMCIVAISNR